MKDWKAIVGVIAVFLLGIAAGGLLTLGIIRHQIAGGAPVMGRLVERRLSWRLRLDATQREQLHTIVTDAQHQLHAVRRQIRPQVEVILDDAVAKERATLRPDQQEKFDRLIARSKARWQQMSGSP